jgi:chromatin segregation and condensation protein Rec8/ScpA/Scc1 (kleisin family)
MLELIKRERVAATQAEMFGEIEIFPALAWDDTTDFELEFGE